MTDEPENVTRLPVRFKEAPDPGGPQFTIVHFEHGRCHHRDQRMLIRKGNAEVECGGCGEKLDPMWCLTQLAIHEMRWHKASRLYQEEMKRLDERSRTKCEHCNQMTRISRR